MAEPKTDSEPIRINKYLALHKYATRRGADELIEAGKVTINGRTAVLGDKVAPGDVVQVDAAAVQKRQSAYAYYAYNKPVGIVTHSPQAGEVDIRMSLQDKGMRECSPIGRLDKDSHGLILLSNDGRLTERLLSPAFDHEKEYRVRVSKPLKQSMLTRLAKGVKLEDGYLTKPAEVWADSDYVLHIVLTEGKRHQIRRMVTACGYEVVDLERVRIMNVQLASLTEGDYRPLTSSEQRQLLTSLGL